MYTVQYPPLGKSRHGGLFPPLNLAIIPWQIHNESIAKSTCYLRILLWSLPYALEKVKSTMRIHRFSTQELTCCR